MYYDIVIIFFTILLIDKTSIYLHNIKYPEKNVHHNVRWFFIHFFINLFIAASTTTDLTYCLNNIEECAYEDISPSSMLAVKSAIVSHLYHCIMFFKDLNHHDWTHHILMVGITGPIAIYFPTKQTACGLWFMSGFPGMIDYFLLWLVKMNMLDKQIEKTAYKYINTWIRSPGCLLTFCFGLNRLMHPETKNDLYVSLINSFLAYWNGQYYMMLTCEAYGKNLERNMRKKRICIKKIKYMENMSTAEFENLFSLATKQKDKETVMLEKQLANSKKQNVV